MHFSKTLCTWHICFPFLKSYLHFKNLFCMNSSSNQQSKWKSDIRAMDQSGHMQSEVPTGKDFMLWMSKIHLGWAAWAQQLVCLCGTLLMLQLQPSRLNCRLSALFFSYVFEIWQETTNVFFNEILSTFCSETSEALVINIFPSPNILLLETSSDNSSKHPPKSHMSILLQNIIASFCLCYLST